MLTQLPFYIHLVFGLTTLLTLVLFYYTIKNSSHESVRKSTPKIIVALIFWLALQALLSIQNFYNSNFNLLPPRIFLFGILPAIMTIGVLFQSEKGRLFMDSLSLKHYTYLHMVRIPVELVLWWLYLNKTIPALMTFEGRNFDIIAGITAPFIAYFGFTKERLNKKVLLAWNFICLGLLINIAIHGLLSAPSPLQKFAFDQPNIALLYFPFSWLVSFIVPIVLFGHIVAIKQLLKTNQ